jgi:menaquinone-dependent protoporphyrinogen IX oxidase
MEKTLVAYASKGGATEETAQIIADVLKTKYEFYVDLVNLKKKSPALDHYGNVVVGAGVRAGRVYGEALKLLEEDFGNRKFAFFVCCGDAGDSNKYADACNKYLQNVLTKYPDLKPIATEAFGGRMKILGKTVFDNVDPAKIRAWAENLGDKLSK